MLSYYGGTPGGRKILPLSPRDLWLFGAARFYTLNYLSLAEIKCDAWLACVGFTWEVAQSPPLTAPEITALGLSRRLRKLTAGWPIALCGREEYINSTGERFWAHSCPIVKSRTQTDPRTFFNAIRPNPSYRGLNPVETRHSKSKHPGVTIYNLYLDCFFSKQQPCSAVLLLHVGATK